MIDSNIILLFIFVLIVVLCMRVKERMVEYFDSMTRPVVIVNGNNGGNGNITGGGNNDGIYNKYSGIVTNRSTVTNSNTIANNSDNYCNHQGNNLISFMRALNPGRVVVNKSIVGGGMDSNFKNIYVGALDDFNKKTEADLSELMEFGSKTFDWFK